LENPSPATVLVEVPRVTRSAVPPGLPYKDYRPYLRTDFLYSCAYCTITESEAQGIRFTIDHYESQTTKPELIDSYGNLLWACDRCNSLKNDLNPPDIAKKHDVRFYRPDWDAFQEHFHLTGRLLVELSRIGQFTIDFLDLNRLGLQRLRDIRQRLYDCNQAVAAGLLALRTFSIDQLPRDLRLKVKKAIDQMSNEHKNVVEMIEAVLVDNARSPLIDDDEEALTRSKARSEKLREIMAIYPGDWRSPNRARKAATSPRGTT